MSDPRPLIVVADDVPEMCELLAEMCADLGQVVALPGGRLLHAYLASAARGEVPAPSVVVTDVQMPTYSGMKALRYIGENLPGTRVILVTAFGDTQLHERATRRGADCVLNKPFEQSSLGVAVSSALRAVGTDCGESMSA